MLFIDLSVMSQAKLQPRCYFAEIEICRYNPDQNGWE